MTTTHDIRGVGLNLRLSYLPDLNAMTTRPEVAFWEVIAENLFEHEDALTAAQALRRDYPIALHCVGMNLAGYDPLDEAYLKRIRFLIEALEPFQVSDHLCWQKHGRISHHDLLPFPLTRGSADHVSQRISRVQHILGRPIAVENLSYYVEFRASTEPEASVLASVAAETGCGLLLDLNNIEVNAHNLGHDPERYLEPRVLEHVVEVHVAGPEEIEGLHLDTHGGLPSSFQLQSIIEHPALNTLPVCYERDTKLPPLDESVGWVERLNHLRGGR